MIWTVAGEITASKGKEWKCEEQKWHYKIQIELSVSFVSNSIYFFDQFKSIHKWI